MRTLMMLTIIAIMSATMAKSDEPINVKVKNYIMNEVNDIKEYQKIQWQKGKEQNANNWNKLKSLLGVK
jgi:hypothetical protein